MEYKKKIEKVITSGKTTGEIIAELELLQRMREFQNALTNMCQTVYDGLEKLNKTIEDGLDTINKIKKGANQ